MLDSRPRGRGFEPHRRHCVVSLSKNINPSLVLVQPRKTRPFITERLLMVRKESNQTNKPLTNLRHRTITTTGHQEDKQSKATSSLDTVVLSLNILRSSSDKACIFPSWHDCKNQIFKLDSCFWKDLWHFDRVSAYFSDASQNFSIHKISPVSFWIGRLTYKERIKLIIRQADPHDKKDSTKGGRGCKRSIDGLGLIRLFFWFTERCFWASSVVHVVSVQ